MSKDTKIAQVEAMEDIVEVRAAATELGVSFSGNSGIDTLKGKVIDAIKAAPDDEDETPAGPTDAEIEEANAQAERDAEAAKAAQTPPAPVPTPDLGQDDDEEIEVAVAAPSNRLSVEELLEMDPNEVEDVKIRRQVIRAKAMRLHRVRITNLDPADASLEGAIITVVNKYISKVSKFIPFGEAGDNGYHVEEVLLNAMRTKKYAMRKEIKGAKFGVKQYKTVMVPKYSIEELPPLTKEEVEALAQRQAAANAIG